MGRRKTVLICFLGSAVGSFLAGFATNLELFFLSRVILGIFGNVTPLLQAYIMDSTPPAQVEGTMGRITAAGGVGFVIGIVSGGILSTQFGAQLPSIVAGIFCLAGFFIVFLGTSDVPKKSSSKGGKGLKDTFVDIYKLWNRPEVTNQLNTRLIQELAMSILNNTISEYARTTLDMTPQARGFLFMYYGILVTFLQANTNALTKFFGSSEQALKKSLMLTGTFSALVPFCSSLPLFVITTSLMQASSSLLYPLSGSMLSRSTDPKEQGSLMGVGESLVNLGGIVGPLFSGFLLPVSIMVPFLTGTAMLATGSRLFPSKVVPFNK